MYKLILSFTILICSLSTVATAQLLKESLLLNYNSNSIFTHGNLLLDTNNIFFSCSESKGFSHIYTGKWSFDETDSVLTLVAYNDFDLIKSITQKKIFQSLFKLRITDYFNKKLHLPCNYDITIINKNGTKEHLDLEYEGLSELTLNPLKVSKIQVDFTIGTWTTSQQIKVKRGQRVTLQLGIPASMFSYRCANHFDDVFVEKYRLSNGKLYDVETNNVVYE